MILRSTARDCLFVNWAIPARHVPVPPAPLRLELASADGDEYAFVSALLFRQADLHDTRAPGVALSHPQCNLSLCVRDEQGQPGVLVVAVLLPWWLVPGARWVAGQPSLRARFTYPGCDELVGCDRWEWRVWRRGGLTLLARRGAGVGAGPSLGSWERTVEFFRHRPKGFVALRGGGLRSIETTHPAVEVWPVAVEARQTRLVERLVPTHGLAAWPQPHSAFLCPEMPAIFELVEARQPALSRSLPAPG